MSEAHDAKDSSFRRLGRRSVLGTIVAASAGVLAGDAVLKSSVEQEERAGGYAEQQRIPESAPVDFPGVTLPGTPQTYCHYTVVTCDTNGGDLRWLEALLAKVRHLAQSQQHVQEVGLPAEVTDLTVALGLGPRMVPYVDGSGRGRVNMPDFAGDADLPEGHRRGDLLVLIATSDLSAISVVQHYVLQGIPQARVTWQQLGMRGKGEGSVARNPLGFEDGIMVPRSESEIFENVLWKERGGHYSTVCFIRQFALDVERFQKLTVPERENIIGRHYSDGSPLSGGAAMDEVNLEAKTPSGEFLTPASAHARAAHPAFTGSGLMLRRSYSYVDSAGQGSQATQGLIFTAFQKELRTFVETQRRMDDMDAMMKFATPRATFSFLMVSPGTPLLPR